MRMLENCKSNVKPCGKRHWHPFGRNVLRPVSISNCERYYSTYGNGAPGPSGAPQQGYFYNLPECQAWLEARDALRVSRSRP